MELLIRCLYVLSFVFPALAAFASLRVLWLMKQSREEEEQYNRKLRQSLLSSPSAKFWREFLVSRLNDGAPVPPHLFLQFLSDEDQIQERKLQPPSILLK